MFRRTPAPDSIISAFTRVFDALWVGTGSPPKNMRHSTIARSKKPGAAAGLECSEV
jgi:hypothetical protein